MELSSSSVSAILVPVVYGLVIGLLLGFAARPTYDRWAFDRYARALCADGKVTTYTDHQITCGRVE